jgi:hypothetical protein
MRRRLLDDLIRADRSLSDRLPVSYTSTDRVGRLALLLLFEWAREHGLNVGELAMLMDEPSREITAGLRGLLVAGLGEGGGTHGHP